MIQLDFKNPDDHFFLQTCAARYGAVFSRPGNGISHYVHLERFDVPWATLVGSDSHTTTAGAVGMFALGIGGMDAAVAMAGHPFELTYPSVVRVVLENKLSPWVSAKDVILEMLRRLTVKGGINKAYAFDGDGVATPCGQGPRGHEYQRDQPDVEWPARGLALRGEVRTQQHESRQADRQGPIDEPGSSRFGPRSGPHAHPAPAA